MLARGALVAAQQPRVDARLVVTMHARQQAHELVNLKFANANQALPTVFVRGCAVPLGKLKDGQCGDLVRLQAAGVLRGGGA